jgi:hypothetical protein
MRGTNDFRPLAVSARNFFSVLVLAAHVRKLVAREAAREGHREEAGSWLEEQCL